MLKSLDTDPVDFRREERRNGGTVCAGKQNWQAEMAAMQLKMMERKIYTLRRQLELLALLSGSPA